MQEIDIEDISAGSNDAVLEASGSICKEHTPKEGSCQSSLQSLRW